MIMIQISLVELEKKMLNKLRKIHKNYQFLLFSGNHSPILFVRKEKGVLFRARELAK